MRSFSGLKRKGFIQNDRLQIKVRLHFDQLVVDQAKE